MSPDIALTHEEMFGLGMLVGILAVYFIVLVVGIVCYIINSLSLYSIAKKRQINNPWLAWLPVGKEWILGSIADKCSNKDRKWSKVLLVLSVIVYAGFVAFFVMAFVIGIIFGMTYQGGAEPPLEAIIGLAIPYYLVAVVIGICSMAYSICYYICLYKMYEEIVPEKPIKYLLISILVPFGLQGCLLKCRKKDGIPAMSPVINIPAEEQE